MGKKVYICILVIAFNQNILYTGILFPNCLIKENVKKIVLGCERYTNMHKIWKYQFWIFKPGGSNVHCKVKIFLDMFLLKIHYGYVTHCMIKLFLFVSNIFIGRRKVQCPYFVYHNLTCFSIYYMKNYLWAEGPSQ